MTQRPSADRYVVEGRGPFPLDMLRRDCAEPASEEDRLAIEAASGDAPATGRRRIALVTSERRTLDERWESFGWRVVRPLRPWSPLAGYAGPEPDEDMPAPDRRRMVSMHVLCDDDRTAMRVEGLLRAAVDGHAGVEIEEVSIEGADIHLERAAAERPRLSRT